MQANELRALGRAMSLMQRDALLGYQPASLGKGGYGVLLHGARAHWLAREQDNQALKRSELRVVEYWLEEGVLWRQRRTQGKTSLGRSACSKVYASCIGGCMCPEAAGRHAGP